MLWIIIMLGCAFFFALHHILRKKILTPDVDILDMMTILSIFASLMLLPFIGYVDFVLSQKNLILIIITAVFAFGGSFLLNVAYKNCEISTVSPMLNINPIMVIFWAYFILGEVLNSIQYIGVFLILIGGYIITLKDIKNFFHPFTSIPGKYFLVVLGTLLMWSFLPVVNRIVLLEYDTFSYLFLFIYLNLLIQLIFMFARRRIRNTFSLFKENKILIIITSFFWVISDFLHLTAVAIPTALVSLLMPVKRIASLFIVIFGGKMFHEKNLIIKGLACVIMLAGLFIIGIYS